MRVLITGICGFVGSQLGRYLRERRDARALEIVGIDNLSRIGSELNRRTLGRLGMRVLHGDIRMASDLEAVGAVDWIVDAAALPSVTAGVDGRSRPRQLVEHNLLGTLNLLEHCRAREAGFILLSTSRVYSIEALTGLEMAVCDEAFRPVLRDGAGGGLTAAGIDETFSTTSPVSLYGATKAASEALALEYHHAFGFPVWIDRCGVIGGAGQFGHAEQGIFSYWINAHLRQRPLRYIGFGGCGYQVRDCLHPADLGALVLRQIESGADGPAQRVVNVAGGAANSMSLRQLSRWCDERFGPRPVGQEPLGRTFDVPWLVLDATRAAELWDWSPEVSIDRILEEIADHAERHPRWLEISGAA